MFLVVVVLLFPYAFASLRSGEVNVASFVSAGCRSDYSSVEFSNVSQSYFEGKNAPIAVMKLDQAYQLTKRTEGCLHAISLDASGSYGGFPEDLAQAASDLGYDILIVRGTGDDSQAYSMASTFWRSLKCPVPTFRIGTIHDQQLKQINASDLFTISNDENPTPGFEASIGVIAFIVEGLLTPIALFYLSGKKFRELYLSGMKWTTGSAVTVICFAQGVLHFVIALEFMVMASTFIGISFVGLSICLGIGAILSLLSLFLVGYRFHLVLSQMNGTNRSIAQRPWRVAFVLCGVLILIYLVGIVTICKQTATTSIYGWYNIASFCHFLFRLVLASYFVWGHLHILKILKVSSGALGKEGAQRLTHMSTRLFGTALLTLASLICFTYAVFPVFYVNHGYFTLNLAGIFTGLSAITEVLAVQTKSHNSETKSQSNAFMSGVVKLKAILTKNNQVSCFSSTMESPQNEGGSKVSSF
jgi:hypothetical protein